MLHIEPLDALIDIPRDIRVDGLTAGEIITITSLTLRGRQVPWSSRIRVRADAAGTVRLDRDAPLEGSYQGVDTMGLCWSQVPEIEGERDLFPEDVLQPITTRVTVTRDKGERWEQDFIQRLGAA